MTNPPAPKTTVPKSITRINVAVCCCMSGENPGAIISRTKSGASQAAMAANSTNTNVTRLSTRLKSSQAPVSSSCAQ